MALPNRDDCAIVTALYQIAPQILSHALYGDMPHVVGHGFEFPDARLRRNPGSSGGANGSGGQPVNDRTAPAVGERFTILYDRGLEIAWAAAAQRNEGLLE